MAINISAWSIRHPLPATVMFAAIVALGYLSFSRLPITQLPNADIPVISVTITQFGTAPAELETQVTKTIEDAVSGVEGVNHITSSITDGIATTTVTFRLETNTDRALNDIKDAITRVRANLPRSIDEPLVQRVDIAGLPILTYAAISPGKTPEQLSWFVEDVVIRALQGVRGVGRVELIGAVQREIRVGLDPIRLQGVGLTPLDVSRQLRGSNVDLAGGRAEIGGREQAIRTLAGAKTLIDLGATKIALPNGGEVRLDDLGFITDTIAEPRTFARFDGIPVVGFSILRAKGASDVGVADAVAAKVATIRAAHPDVELKLIDSSVGYTLGNYHSALHTLYEGAALAVLVVFLFLRDLRATVIAAITLPLSILPAFWVMDVLGFSLNMVSLLAITLSTGILVDDAIVEIENIVRHIRQGKSPYQAAIEAADEIGLAVIAISLTIVAIFVPASFMQSIPGQFFKQFGITVSVQVLFSLLCARLITPMLAAYFLRPHQRVEKGDGFVLRLYTRLITWSVRHRFITIAIGLIFFIGSIWSTGLLPSGFLPDIDKARSLLAIELPPGSQLGDNETISDSIVRQIRARPEVSSVFVDGGRIPPGVTEVRKSTLTINYVPKSDRAISQRQLELAISRDLNDVPDIRFWFLDENGKRNVTLIVTGQDNATVANVASELAAQMQRLPEITNVVSTSSMNRPELRIYPRRDLAVRLGVSTESLSETIRVATIGDVGPGLAKFDAGDRVVPIRVLLEESARADKAALEQIRVPSPRAGGVPLGALADIEFAAGPISINRHDRQRQATLEADLVGGSALSTAMAAIKALPVMQSLPPGIQVTEAGDAELQAELFDGFGSSMRNGLMMVYVVLAILFGSLLQPLTIMISLPLALGGAIVGLLATNKPISAPVVIGILMLMGIVTKNAIMLVDFAIEAMRRGVDRTTAIIESGRMRARPIVMTTIAMAAGMAPSALALGAGGEFRSPMAIAVIGGLTASTLLSLLFVPTLFTLVDDIGRITGRVFGRLIGPSGEGAPAPGAPPPSPAPVGGLPTADAPRLVPQLTPQGTPPRISAEPAPGDGRILICANADNSIRWQEGERLNDLFEQRCDELHDSEAVVTDAATYSFRDLDNRANQAARYLLGQGLKSGDRIGLVFDKTFDTYVALLAVLKINAAYVPLDAGFPNDRISFICSDADVKAILSLSIFQAKLDVLDVPKIFLDTAAGGIDAQPAGRLTESERGAPVDQLAYLIYTSGTTGTPKGVAIEHASICNFVRVAAEVYGMKPGDRCYQGMTIAFDFSVEELWVPLLAGTTLVPGKPGTSLVGSDLADYLQSKHVTVMCCVPTLLGTIERDLPDLRILLVSGEACPQNLVTRWQRPGRIMLNAYGPTETTVTCTLTELYPNKPVTIGGPLPTYSVVILAEDKDEAFERGAMGEIGIAGIGLAAGYLNREDLTQKKFIPDFLNIPNNPSGRIYRTGDLGRINDNYEVEFHGRIDTQVKIRGYRIELAEIESVLEQMPHISQAVVNVYEPEPGAAELVAYYTLKQGTQDPPHSEVAEKLRKHLPPYMVPAYLERLDIIPMTTSHKADRKALPLPKGTRMAVGSGNFVAPKTPTEEALVRALGDVMKIDRISVADNFFQDLGAHSLLMARFGSEIRKRLRIAAVSMRDIYLNPTVEKLAAHLDTLPAEAPMQMNQEPIRAPSALAYYTCGFFQFLVYLAASTFGLWLLVRGLEWVYEAAGNWTELYSRSVIFGLAMFAILTALPILGKWLLVGRFKATTFPVWGLRYFRFWLVRSLIQINPMALFAGSPLYNVYLRMLGMRIGRDCVIASTLVPVCTDLISIGDNAVVRRDAVVQGYKARSGLIQTGPIRIGDNAYVGEAAVLDIDTVMEDDTQLGHASSLQTGQRVPRGKHYHGSPAQETTADYCPLAMGPASRLRRVLYSIYQLLIGFAVAVPAATMLGYYAYRLLNDYTSAQLIHETFVPALLTLSLEMMAVSLVFTLALLPLGLVGVYLVPRLLNLFLREDKRYALYGVRHIISQTISGVSNSAVLLHAVRRQLVHRLLSQVDRRLSPEQHRADRREFRPRPAPRQPVPVRHRLRHDGVGRADDDQRPPFQRRVQAQQGQDRRPQLPRQQHPLSGRRQGRRELPARHQGHDPDRRADAGERRAPGLAELRNSARRRARQASQSADRRQGPARTAQQKERLQYQHHDHAGAGELVLRLHRPALGLHCAAAFPSARLPGDLGVRYLLLAHRASSGTRWSSVPASASAASSRSSCRCISRISGTTNGTGSSAARR